MSNMNLVCGLDSRIFWWKFKLIENKRCLSQRLKSSFLFVNEPFAIKCCATTQTKALLYIYWPLMINMLFVEQISFQINFSAGNILCGGDLSITCRATKRSSFIDMQIWDEPCRLQTPPYDDTQGNVNRRENGRKLRKGTRKRVMNFSPTCRQKPERQYSRTICCQRNSILQRPKKYIVFIIWPAEIGFCPG